MTGLPPLHPLIVHTPIAMIIVSLLFELIGRVTDIAWWRKAAFAMLLVGVIGAAAAVLTGDKAGDAAEHQGISEQTVDHHGDAGKLTLWLGLAALAVRALAGRAGGARRVAGGLALALHLAAAIAVSVAGFRGGQLVYEHGAGVKAGAPGAAADSAAGKSGEASEPGEQDGD